MNIPAIENAGAISLPHSGRYVVHLENMSAVIDAALAADAKVSIVGRTSSSTGAAYIVDVTGRDPGEKSAENFFANPPNAAGLSQALLDVVQRRS
jgi:hypothetical protein